MAGTLLIVTAPTGCDSLPYVVHLAQGELGVQGNTEPIDKVLDSGRLTDDEAAKLRLIVKARDYAANHMGLNVENAYTTFYDTSGDALAYNLSAARRDALEARTWWFPLVGEVPYLAFFDEAYMRMIEEQLVAEGCDTLTYELDAYSTLGLLEDPVRSTMLRRHELSLVETIIHELLHNTVWRLNNTVFNESLATFVGRRGAVEFLQAEFGEDSSWPAVAASYYADLDRINAFLLRLYADLDAHFAQPISSEEKITGREAVYQAGRDRFTDELLPTLNYPDSFASYAELPTNNAWMLAHYRYNLDLDLMEAVFTAVGEDWPAALAVFQAAANAPEDPFAYLRNWLAQREPQ
jgi:predicted aminopeptidase